MTRPEGDPTGTSAETVYADGMRLMSRVTTTTTTQVETWQHPDYVAPASSATVNCTGHSNHCTGHCDYASFGHTNWWRRRLWFVRTAAPAPAPVVQPAPKPVVQTTTVTQPIYFRVEAGRTETYHPYAGVFAFLGALAGLVISLWFMYQTTPGDVNIFVDGISTVTTSLRDNNGLWAWIVGLSTIGGAGIGVSFGLLPWLSRTREPRPRRISRREAEVLETHSSPVV